MEQGVGNEATSPILPNVSTRNICRIILNCIILQVYKDRSTETKSHGDTPNYEETCVIMEEDPKVHICVYNYYSNY